MALLIQPTGVVRWSSGLRPNCKRAARFASIIFLLGFPAIVQAQGAIRFDLYDGPVTCSAQSRDCRTTDDQAAHPETVDGFIYRSDPSSRFSPPGWYFHTEIPRPSGNAIYLEMDLPPAIEGQVEPPAAVIAYLEFFEGEMVFSSSSITGIIQVAPHAQCRCQDLRFELQIVDAGPDRALETSDDQMRYLSLGIISPDRALCLEREYLPITESLVVQPFDQCPNEPPASEAQASNPIAPVGPGPDPHGASSGRVGVYVSTEGGCADEPMDESDEETGCGGTEEDTDYSSDDSGCEGDGSYEDSSEGCGGDMSSSEPSSEGCEGSSDSSYSSYEGEGVGCEDASSSDSSCEGDAMAHGKGVRMSRLHRRQPIPASLHLARGFGFCFPIACAAACCCFLNRRTRQHRTRLTLDESVIPSKSTHRVL